MKLEEKFDRWMNDAEKSEDFQVEKLILHFTGEVVAAMKERNLSQADLARRLDKSPAYVSKMLAGVYMIDKKRHSTPHIHAKYAEFEASISIPDGEVLAGTLPRKQLRLVLAWIELHKDELMANWDLARSGEIPYKISPL